MTDRRRSVTIIFIIDCLKGQKITNNAHYSSLQAKVMSLNAIFCPTKSPKLKNYENTIIEDTVKPAKVWN